MRTVTAAHRHAFRRSGAGNGKPKEAAHPPGAPDRRTDALGAPAANAARRADKTGTQRKPPITADNYTIRHSAIKVGAGFGSESSKQDRLT